MNIDNLVTMANQIGTFYASFPDREEAHTGIALHIERLPFRFDPRLFLPT